MIYNEWQGMSLGKRPVFPVPTKNEGGKRNEKMLHHDGTRFSDDIRNEDGGHGSGSGSDVCEYG
jgi:hypothetical protein